MKEEESIVITIVRYPSTSSLSAEDTELIQVANEALEKSYSPYSKFRVAAAIRMANGEILTGSNQENAAYPSGLCAERVALFAAKHRWPDVDVSTMAIAASSDIGQLNEPVSPCGACRQVLLEYELNQTIPMRLLLCGEKGDVALIPSSKSLLPLYFNKEFLNQK